MPSPLRAFTVPPRYRWIALGIAVVVAVVLLIASPYLVPAATPQELATRACESAVREQTGDPAARIEDVRTSNITESVLTLGLEQVTDVAVNGYVTRIEGGQTLSERFVCRAHVDQGKTSITDITVD